MAKLTILGAGAWGSALAKSVLPSKTNILLWARTPHSFQEDIHGVKKTTNLLHALEWSHAVIIAIPAQQLRNLMQQIRLTELTRHPAYIIASKGLEQKSGALMSEIIQESLGNQIQLGAISGPNLAHEILQGTPSGLSIATSCQNISEFIAQCFSKGPIQPEILKDIIGIQVFGALKNSMAIGYGLLSSCSSAKNLLATYITHAAQEIQKFALLLGSDPNSFLSFAGIGDMILTCTSPKSRNFRYGYEFSSTTVSSFLAEGKFTTFAALERAKKIKATFPLIDTIASILSSKIPVQKIVTFYNPNL